MGDGGVCFLPVRWRSGLTSTFAAAEVLDGCLGWDSTFYYLRTGSYLCIVLYVSRDPSRYITSFLPYKPYDDLVSERRLRISDPS